MQVWTLNVDFIAAYDRMWGLNSGQGSSTMNFLLITWLSQMYGFSVFHRLETGQIDLLPTAPKSTPSFITTGLTRLSTKTNITCPM